jgi:hypothetical protein
MSVVAWKLNEIHSHANSTSNRCLSVTASKPRRTMQVDGSQQGKVATIIRLITVIVALPKQSHLLTR